MPKPDIQDDITISLKVQKTIVHETVRIGATIQAQVDPNQPETEFRRQVHSALREFIPGDWKIQSINRAKGQQFEGVAVQATVRVPDKENYQLEARAQKVSRIGFEINYPRAEYELTFDEIQAVNQELRLMLLEHALDECNEINLAFAELGHKSQFRISSTRFDAGDVAGSTNRATSSAYGLTMATSASASPSPLGGGIIANAVYTSEQEEDADDGSEDMGVSTRFSMTGTFVLRSLHRG